MTLAIVVVLLLAAPAAQAMQQSGDVAGQAMRLATGGTALGRGSVDLFNNKFGVCLWVDNNSAIDYFLPDGDSAGWNSFISNRPAGVVLDRCCLAQSVTLTSSDGRSATDALINGRNRAGHALSTDTAVATFAMSRQDCTTHCNGTSTCNTTAWTETVTRNYTCGGSGWTAGSITRSATPAVNAPVYQACPLTSGPWTVGAWGACSATACGTSGTKTRSVTCNYDSCTGAQPAAVASCSAPACGWTYSWDDTSCSCSTACGTGSNVCTATCKRNDGAAVSASNCGGTASIPGQGSSCTESPTTPVVAYWSGVFGRGYGGQRTDNLQGITNALQWSDPYAPVTYCTNSWGLAAAWCQGGRATGRFTLSVPAVNTAVNINATYSSTENLGTTNPIVNFSIGGNGSVLNHLNTPAFNAIQREDGGDIGGPMVVTNAQVMIPLFDNQPRLMSVMISYSTNSCSVSPTCGQADGTTSYTGSSAPAAQTLCAVGTPSAVTGSGATGFDWTCEAVGQTRACGTVASLCPPGYTPYEYEGATYCIPPFYF